MKKTVGIITILLIAIMCFAPMVSAAQASSYRGIWKTH